MNNNLCYPPKLLLTPYTHTPLLNNLLLYALKTYLSKIKYVIRMLLE